MRIKRLVVAFAMAAMLAVMPAVTALAQTADVNALQQEYAEYVKEAEVANEEQAPEEELTENIVKETEITLAVDDVQDSVPAEEEKEADDIVQEEVQQKAGTSELVLETTAADGMKVTLTASADAFESCEGLELIVEIVSEEDAAVAEDEIDKQSGSQNVAKRVTYDIRVEKEGVEQQPVEGKEVHVAFSLPEVPSGADEVTIYHHDEAEGLEVIAAEALTASDDIAIEASGTTGAATDTDSVTESMNVTEEDLEDLEILNDLTVEGDTDSFSLYTVDFTYDDKTVSIAGDSARNDLTDVLAEVGITDSIEYVEVYSDNEFKNKCDDGIVTDGEKVLFRVYQEGSTWYVDAVNAFTSEHGIIVITPDETTYRVKVTDASEPTTGTEMSVTQVANMFNNAVDGKVKLTEDILVKKTPEEISAGTNIDITRATGSFDLNGYKIHLGDKALRFSGDVKWDIYDSKYQMDKNVDNGMGFIWINNSVAEARNGAVVNIYGGYIHPNAYCPVVQELGGHVNILGGVYEGYYLWTNPGYRYVAGGKFKSNKPSDKNIDGTSIPDRDGGSECVPGTSVVAQITSAGAMSGKTSITNAVADGMTIVMLKDLAENITIPNGKNVILNLNGKVLEGNITIAEGGSLTLRNTSDVETHTGAYTSLPTGGVLKGRVENSGTFVMDGGTITGNTATNGGGVNNSGTFTMNGGTITGNTATNGGGVYNAGTLTLSGSAVITGNTDSSTNANNLYLNNNTFAIGASGMSDEAEIGISVPSGATIPYTLSASCDTDYHESFSSDKSTYEVAYANNLLVLKVPGPSEYTVSFDPNGGTGDMADVQTSGGMLNLPENGFTAPSGKDFDGWGVGSATAETTAPGTEITLTEDTTVYAKWKDQGGAEDPGQTPSKGEEWTAAPSVNGSATAPVTGGVWNSVSGGFTYTLNGEVLRNSKAWITYTAADGRQYTGCFYFDKNGRMATGWQLIDGVWYFFEPAAGPTQGMLYVSRTTPDGYVVDADGKWIK